MTTLKQAAAEIVERARAGDQNAIGTLIVVRRNAIRGVEQAQKAHKAMVKYAKANPPQDFGADISRNTAPLRYLTAKIHGDSEETYNAIAKVSEVLEPRQISVALSRGPKLYGKTNRLAELVKLIAQDEKEQAALAKAILHCKKPGHLWGRCIGYARLYQLVRDGHLPIKELSANVGWELGE